MATRTRPDLERDVALAEEAWMPFSMPTIEEDDVESVVRCLRSGWLTSGPLGREFEEAFAAYVGAKHAIAVNSCTAALHLALEAAGVGPGDEVITSPLTFTATAAVIEHLGARPVLADVDPVTLNLDPACVAATVTSWTRAIVPVHFAGQACDMNPLLAIAGEHELKIVEDAAHALPTRYGNDRIGTIGDATCFSFYVTKTITTGEGGMVTTESDVLAERVRSMRLHGMSRDAWNRYGKGGSWSYDVIAPGFKDNLPDLAAALGLTQLAKSDRFHARRRAIARAYDDALSGIDGLRTPQVEDMDGHAWHLYLLQVDGRDRFIEELAARGIGTSVHFIPLHHLSYYRERYGYRASDFPVATRAFERIVSLPIYPRMTDADVARVIDAVCAVAQEVKS